jgi:hypothetical protein
MQSKFEQCLCVESCKYSDEAIFVLPKFPKLIEFKARLSVLDNSQKQYKAGTRFPFHLVLT